MYLYNEPKRTERMNQMDIERILSEMTLEEKVSLCSGRDFWHTKAIERLGVPAVMMCDGPHGLRKQEGKGDHLGINRSIETVCYPTASALASSFDRDLMARLGTALGQECQAENVAMLLGPGLNMKRSPLCGRNFEYFSEDPYLAGELGAAYIHALQDEGVAACVKHFAANNQETRRMSGSSNMDERTLHEIYLPAFEAAVKQGKARSVMCAYNAINGEYCAQNGALLNDILRDQWGYDGFVVTDWGAVKDRAKGLRAGLDLEMPGGGGVQDSKILAAVQSGELDEVALDMTVRRMLQFVADAVEARCPDTTIDRAENARLSADMAAQCAVLMKNEGDLLPLGRASKTLFIGDFADAPRYQGAGSSHINVPHAVSARAAAPDVPWVRGFDRNTTSTVAALLAEAVAAARAAENVVIFAGLPDAFETEGCDRDDLELPANQNELIRAVAAVNPNVAVVLHGGSPMTLPWVNEVRAILCMYLGGQGVGEAAVKLLFGEKNPSGKLAETWPLRLEDTPAYLDFPGERGVSTYTEGVFMGYRWYDARKMDVLFPFGYGLSYTSFAYSDLAVTQKDDAAEVRCTVRNVGSRAGKEAVQLYIGAEGGEVRRSTRELKGFEKVTLAPGEETTVCFTLDRRAFAYWETLIHDWHVPAGTYRIEVGASSRDIRLSTTLPITAARDLPLVFTPYSPVGDLVKTAKGRAFFEQMNANRRAAREEDYEQKTAESMGAGSEKMMARMAQEMPLINLVSYGAMTFEQLDGLLKVLN